MRKPYDPVMGEYIEPRDILDREELQDVADKRRDRIRHGQIKFAGTPVGNDLFLMDGAE